MKLKWNKKESKRILLYFGNPHTDSCSGMVADVYEKAAKEAGHEVIRMNMSEMDYDPVLHDGYRSIQELEPTLLDFQKNINWANHLVFIYPNWWSAMPAKMKGLFDRSFVPGFAFKFGRDKQGKRNNKVEKLLKGKSAHIFVICGSDSPKKTRRNVGDYSNELVRGILGFVGIGPIRISSFGPSHTSEKKKEGWCKKISALAKKSL